MRAADTPPTVITCGARLAIPVHLAYYYTDLADLAALPVATTLVCRRGALHTGHHIDGHLIWDGHDAGTVRPAAAPPPLRAATEADVLAAQLTQARAELEQVRAAYRAHLAEVAAVYNRLSYRCAARRVLGQDDIDLVLSAVYPDWRTPGGIPAPPPLCGARVRVPMGVLACVSGFDELVCDDRFQGHTGHHLSDGVAWDGDDPDSIRTVGVTHG